MKILILTLVFSFSVMAQDCVDCQKAAGVPAVVDKGLIHFMEHFGSSEGQTSAAPCKHMSFNSDVMNQWLTSLAGKKDAKISGVRFKDENPELLRAFKNLTYAGSGLPWWIRTFNKFPGIDAQKNYSINPQCEKVLCAVDKMWGRDVGRKLLYLNLVYGYNGSEFLSADGTRFTDAELDDVLLTMEDLPRHMIPVFRNHRLAKSSNKPDDPLTVADSGISLYGPWVGGKKAYRHYTLMHEVAHNLHGKLPPVQFKHWYDMSGWVKEGDNWKFDTIGACMISKYGMTSPNEDFAETAATYRYDAHKLKDVCPAKYQFMKQNVFGGVEFLEPSQCSGR